MRCSPRLGGRRAELAAPALARESRSQSPLRECRGATGRKRTDQGSSELQFCLGWLGDKLSQRARNWPALHPCTQPQTSEPPPGPWMGAWKLSLADSSDFPGCVCMCVSHTRTRALMKEVGLRGCHGAQAPFPPSPTPPHLGTLHAAFPSSTGRKEMKELPNPSPG